MNNIIPEFLLSDNGGHNTFTATYWYRKARNNRFALARAEYYDKRAGMDGRDSERERYHSAYRLWRKSDYSDAMAKMILYLLATN